MTTSQGSLRRAVGGIRTRVVAGYVALAAIALVSAVLVTRQVLLRDLDRRIDADLAQEAEELRALTVGTNPATGDPFGTDVAAIFDTFLSRSVPNRQEAFFTIVDGAPHRYSLDPPAQLLDDAAMVEEWWNATTSVRHTVQSDAGTTRTLAVPLRGDQGQVRGVFVVAAFSQEALDEIGQVVRVLTAASLVLLAVSSAVAWGIAGGVIRPVRTLTDAARRITSSDLTARIPVQGHDELADLGRTFNDMVERVDEGMRSQRAFLNDVAHELRTPLTIIRGHLEVLGDDPVERDETVALVTDELDRMSRYVSDLLVLARSGEPDFLRFEPIDVHELITNLFHKVEALGDRTWRLDEAPRAGAVAAVVDLDRVNQAMVSLADNAVHHTAPGDEIGVGARVDAGHLRLWVRDTGPGVDPAVQDQIFDRRARAAASRVSRPDGLGIGLAIVASIASAHGGDVTVDSEPARGATFTLRIPIDPEEPTP